MIVGERRSASLFQISLFFVRFGMLEYIAQCHFNLFFSVVFAMFAHNVHYQTTGNIIPVSQFA